MLINFDIAIGIFGRPYYNLHSLVFVLHIQILVLNFGKWVWNGLVDAEHRYLVFIEFQIYAHLYWIIKQWNSVLINYQHSCLL